jgi:uncharacterized protein (TIGR03067 family)
MARCIIFANLVALSGIILALGDHNVEGCASIGRPHDSIHIAEESAIIVWDPLKKVEHFIRSASFDTKSPDFGFLVPTPTQPTLAEVGSKIFGDVDRWTLPRTVERTRLTYQPLLFCCLPSMKMGAMVRSDTAGVRILAEQEVGGFKAAVLEADDTDSLSKWITEHGYSSDPELQSWLAPYVLAKWKITAFKIIQDSKTGELATTKPVRMSFSTDRPFFPYREPERKRDKKVDAEPENEKHQPRPTEIDGIWKIESADGDASQTRELKGTKFWFDKGIAVGHFIKDSPFTVDASKDPKWLDLGKIPGIYKLDGDTLTWCRGANARPSRFDSKEGLLLVLRRDTKANADAAAAGVAAREKERLHGGDRLLRVHFVSDTRMEGKFGNNSAWHAKTPWSDQLDDEQRKDLAKQTGIAETDLPAKTWLTTFEDRASPRPGKEEVYFDPSSDRTPIRPPDRVEYNDVWIPLDVLLIGVVFVGYVGFRVIRRRSGTST